MEEGKLGGAIRAARLAQWAESGSCGRLSGKAPALPADERQAPWGADTPKDTKTRLKGEMPFGLCFFCEKGNDSITGADKRDTVFCRRVSDMVSAAKPPVIS